MKSIKRGFIPALLIRLEGEIPSVLPTLRGGNRPPLNARISIMPKRKRQKPERDSVYFLKLLMFFLLGSFWLRITVASGAVVGLPVGLVAGLILASHDHFAIDRKIEYAVLLIATALSAYIPIVGFWV